MSGIVAATRWFSRSSSENGWVKYVSMVYFTQPNSGLLLKDVCLVEADVCVHGITSTLWSLSIFLHSESHLVSSVFESTNLHSESYLAVCKTPQRTLPYSLPLKSRNLWHWIIDIAYKGKDTKYIIFIFYIVDYLLKRSKKYKIWSFNFLTTTITSK